MKIAVLRETQEGEGRVSLMPESVKKLVGLGASVHVESHAGLSAARADKDYREAGAEVSSDREALLADADVLAVVNRPAANDFARLKKGAVVIGFLRPLDEPAALLPALDRGTTTFSVELIPRITRAQAMDALSSMATVAGYKAVLIGAAHIPRMFPSGRCHRHACSCSAPALRDCKRSQQRDVWVRSSKVMTCAPRRASKLNHLALRFLKSISAGSKQKTRVAMQLNFPKRR
jgi:NAD/NADP transhydrogenase alpha subunit